MGGEFGGDTCVCMAELLCCALETITTLLMGYTQYKIKILKSTHTHFYQVTLQLEIPLMTSLFLKKWVSKLYAYNQNPLPSASSYLSNLPFLTPLPSQWVRAFLMLLISTSMYGLCPFAAQNCPRSQSAFAKQSTVLNSLVHFDPRNSVTHLPCQPPYFPRTNNLPSSTLPAYSS